MYWGIKEKNWFNLVGKKDNYEGLHVIYWHEKSSVGWNDWEICFNFKWKEIKTMWNQKSNS